MGAIVASQVNASTRGPARVDEFIDGYHLALYVAACIALAGAVVAVATVRKYRHAPAGATA
jgi:hypothetical protein